MPNGSLVLFLSEQFYAIYNLQAVPFGTACVWMGSCYGPFICSEIIVSALFAQIAIEEGDDLSTSAEAVGSKGGAVNTGGNIVIDRPQNCIIVICTGSHILEVVGSGYSRSLCIAVEEGNDLTSGTALFRGEGSLAHTGSNALLYSPKNCFIVVILFLNIREGICTGCRLRLTGCSPKEGYNLSTGAGTIRSKEV